MSRTLEAPPDITVACMLLKAFVTPVDTPSTSPSSTTSIVIEFNKPTTGGSFAHPASISYGPTSTVVCAYADANPNPRINRPIIAIICFTT